MHNEHATPALNDGVLVNNKIGDLIHLNIITIIKIAAIVTFNMGSLWWTNNKFEDCLSYTWMFRLGEQVLKNTEEQ